MTDVKDMNFWQTAKDLPNRLITFVWKMLSVKGAALVATFFLIRNDAFNSWEQVVVWVLVVLMVIGGREADKWKDVFLSLRKEG